jgi:hypothetical protein
VGGGHLPPYVCIGLVINLACKAIFAQWTGDQFDLQDLFDMGGGHLPLVFGMGYLGLSWVPGSGNNQGHYTVDRYT